MTLTVGGIDLSTYLADDGYSVSYEARGGANTRTMLNGDEYVDTLAWKANINATLLALSDSVLSTLMSTVLTTSTISVTFTDPKTNADRTGTFTAAGLSEQKYLLTRGSTRYYASGITLSLRER